MAVIRQDRGPAFKAWLAVLSLSGSLVGCAENLSLDGTATVGQWQLATGAATASKEVSGGAASSSMLQAKASPKSDADKSEAIAGSQAANSTSTTEPPKEVRAALVEARKLKAAGQAKEAQATLEKAATVYPNERALGVEQGLLALELGQSREARALLAKTTPTEAKDWRALSGLGVAHASLGQQAAAQRYFKQALEIDPNNATVLNNLAMSLILDRKIDEAEALLRRASAGGAAKPTVAQNLALAQSLKSLQSAGASSTP